jgi:hypothetical protein
MDCSLQKCLAESKGILAYRTDVNRYYNTTPCRIEQGIVGGNDVSIYDGNLVDLDSELSGRTRQATKCPKGRYIPGTIIQDRDTISCKSLTDCSKEVNKRLTHLPTCNIINYKPKPKSVGYNLNNYNNCQSTIGNTTIQGYSSTLGSSFAKF